MDCMIGGVRCHYAQQGQGRDVLLLHGWGGNIESWLPVTEHLAKKCRVTVLDFPGHGGSGSPPNSGWSVDDYRDFTAEFLEKAGIAPCDIVAHSFGGRVALLLAATRPELVSRMLLTGCAGLLPRRSAASKAKSSVFHALKNVSDHIPGGKALREKVAGHLGSTDYRALAPGMRATFVKVVNQDLAPVLPRISAETLLVFGRNDQETPLWMGEALRDGIRGSALVVLENAGHFAYLEQCAAFLRIMDAFFFPEGKEAR